MISGAIMPMADQTTPNAGAETVTLHRAVADTGDRPMQIGGLCQRPETDVTLDLDRTRTRSQARIQPRGMRVDRPAGAAMRLEILQSCAVTLVAFWARARWGGFTQTVCCDL